MPNAMSIQQAFNNALYSISRSGLFEGEAGAEDAPKAAKPLTEYQKENLALREKALGIQQQKTDIKAAQEQRLQEDLIDKQKRTEGLTAFRKASAEVEKAQAGMIRAQAGALKEKTAGQALKRKKAEFNFKQQKSADRQAGQSALDKYESSVAALNGQKTGLQQRREMLQQIQLEI